MSQGQAQGKVPLLLKGQPARKAQTAFDGFDGVKTQANQNSKGQQREKEGRLRHPVQSSVCRKELRIGGRIQKDYGRSNMKDRDPKADQAQIPA